MWVLIGCPVTLRSAGAVLFSSIPREQGPAPMQLAGDDQSCRLWSYVVSTLQVKVLDTLQIFALSVPRSGRVSALVILPYMPCVDGPTFGPWSQSLHKKEHYAHLIVMTSPSTSSR